MSVELPKVKEDFASIVGSLVDHPWKMLQFILWLDLKLAEYKVYGSMLLDSSFGHTCIPKWLDFEGSCKLERPCPERPVLQDPVPNEHVSDMPQATPSQSLSEAGQSECVIDNPSTTASQSVPDTDPSLPLNDIPPVTPSQPEAGLSKRVIDISRATPPQSVQDPETIHSKPTTVVSISRSQNVPACSKRNVRAIHSSAVVPGSKRRIYVVQYAGNSAIFHEIPSQAKVSKKAPKSPIIATDNMIDLSSNRDVPIPVLEVKQHALDTSSSQDANEGILPEVNDQHNSAFLDTSSLQDSSSRSRANSSHAEVEHNRMLIHTISPNTFIEENSMSALDSITPVTSNGPSRTRVSSPIDTSVTQHQPDGTLRAASTTDSEPVPLQWFIKKNKDNSFGIVPQSENTMRLSEKDSNFVASFIPIFRIKTEPVVNINKTQELHSGTSSNEFPQDVSDPPLPMIVGASSSVDKIACTDTPDEIQREIPPVSTCTDISDENPAEMPPVCMGIPEERQSDMPPLCTDISEEGPEQTPPLCSDIPVEEPALVLHCEDISPDIPGEANRLESVSTVTRASCSVDKNLEMPSGATCAGVPDEDPAGALHLSDTSPDVPKEDSCLGPVRPVTRSKLPTRTVLKTR